MDSQLTFPPHMYLIIVLTLFNLLMIFIVCEVLRNANICEGNNDSTFIELFYSRGGKIMNVSNLVVTFMDSTGSTVRHQNCALLCEGAVSKLSTRASLIRALVSKAKKQNSESKTDSSSHANYRYLQPKELTTWLMYVQWARRNAEKNVSKLKEKLNSMIEKEGIDLAEDDLHELEELFAHGAKEMSKLNLEHFHCIF